MEEIYFDAIFEQLQGPGDVSKQVSVTSASASISKTTTTSATVPPLKRWKAEAAKESAQNQKVESPMVFKKQWMKRHIAEVVSEIASFTQSQTKIPEIFGKCSVLARIFGWIPSKIFFKIWFQHFVCLVHSITNDYSGNFWKFSEFRGNSKW
ncbi:unnamed protein product [Caenorhabditis angaria]|uniref:Uncharacterized protein n=1 Tax=Caenorhabditis angaria TaxID=860376 RepID=A0A9P1N101_9PELO|nr:unnamed protein product [Caenorhabditis angaria]